MKLLANLMIIGSVVTQETESGIPQVNDQDVESMLRLPPIDILMLISARSSFDLARGKNKKKRQQEEQARQAAAEQAAAEKAAKQAAKQPVFDEGSADGFAGLFQGMDMSQFSSYDYLTGESSEPEPDVEPTVAEPVVAEVVAIEELIMTDEDYALMVEASGEAEITTTEPTTSTTTTTTEEPTTTTTSTTTSTTTEAPTTTTTTTEAPTTTTSTTTTTTEEPTTTTTSTTSTTTEAPTTTTSTTTSTTTGTTLPSCDAGFEYNGTECMDINECQRGTFECSEQQVCVNNLGGYKCKCADGKSHCSKTLLRFFAKSEKLIHISLPPHFKPLLPNHH